MAGLRAKNKDFAGFRGQKVEKAKIIDTLGDVFQAVAGKDKQMQGLRVFSQKKRRKKVQKDCKKVLIFFVR